MVIPGYDPDDIDETLEVMMERGDPSDYLTDEEIERWKDGESLLDLLDEGDIDRLLEKAPEDVEPTGG